MSEKGFGKEEVKPFAQNGEVERGVTAATDQPWHPKHKRRCKTTVITTLIVVMVMVLVGVILAVTVFKVRDPRIKIVSASVEGVAPRVSFPAIKVELNITLNLTLQVHNPNHASFRGGQGKSVLTYEAHQVGEANFDPGLIPARGTSSVAILLTLEIDRFADSGASSLVGDVMAGELHVGAKTNVPGRVNLLGIIRKHIVSTSDCQFVIQFPEFKIKSQDCKNHIKL